MNLQEFHKVKYYEAKALGNEERALHHDKRYTKIVVEKESKVLINVLLTMIVVTIVAPFVVWWLGSR